MATRVLFFQDTNEETIEVFDKAETHCVKNRLRFTELVVKALREYLEKENKNDNVKSDDRR